MSALINISSLNRAFKNVSVSNTTFAAQQTAYAADATAFANSFNDAALSDAALANLVLTNMGILPSSEASVQALEPALAEYFTKHGNRGVVVMQLAELLSNLENATGSLAVYKSAAAAWNQEVVNAAAYSSNVANTVDSDKPAAGGTYTLTTATNTFVGTAGNDTFTATDKTLTSGDALVDASTTDADVLNVTVSAFVNSLDTTGTSIRGVEATNVAFDSLVTANVDARGITGTLTVSQNRAGSGATSAVTQVTDGTKVVAGAGVNSLTVTTDNADRSTTVDGGAADTLVSATVSGKGNVTVTANSAATATAVAATGSATVVGGKTTANVTGATTSVTTAATNVNVTGTAGTTDVATVNASGTAVALAIAANVEKATVSGNAAALTATVTTFAGELTVAGDQDVTLKMTSVLADGMTKIVDATTAGKTTVELTTVAAADLSTVGADSIKFKGSAALGTYTVADKAYVEIATDVTGATTFTATDGSATTYLKGTLNLTLSDDVNGAAVILTNSGATSDGIDTLNVAATVAQTGLAITGGTAAVVLTGSKDVDLANTSTAKTFDASAMTGKLTAEANGTLLDIKSGSGNDTLTVASTSTSLKVAAGAGNDTVNTAVAVAGSIAGGAGTNTLNVTAAVDLSAATITDFTYLNVNANAVTFDEAVLNDKSIVINGTGTAIAKNIEQSIDLSKLVFASTAGTTVDFSTARAGTLGASANFTATGSDNADAITTGNGTNSVNAGKGDDTVTGGTSVDSIDGGDGADTISANSGNDAILGGKGADKLLGQDGNDSITAGEDSDAVSGGAGADTIVLTETTAVADYVTFQALTDGSAAGAAAGTFTGYDVVTGFKTGTDKIVFDGAAALTADTVVTTDIVTGALTFVAGTAATTDSKDLTAADIANVDKVAAFLSDGTYTTSTAGNNDIVAITFSGLTALYVVTDAAAGGAIAATEVKLLGTVDATLVAGDITV